MLLCTTKRYLFVARSESRVTAATAVPAKMGGASSVAAASAAVAVAGPARSTNPFLSGGAATTTSASQRCQEGDDLVFEEFARIRLKGHEGEEPTQELGEPAGDVEA